MSLTGGTSTPVVRDYTHIDLLHVEDDPEFAELTASWLERELEAVSVTHVTDPTEAVTQLEREPFDCIVSDYDLPRMDGISFLKQVRESYPELPFILFTGKGSEQVASDAFSAGATDYVQKQAGADQFEILVNRITNAVDKYRTRQHNTHQRIAIESAREALSILDRDGEFVYVNQAYADLYGYTPEEMVGEHWSLIYKDEEIEFVKSEIIPTATSTGFWQGETTGLRADGSTFPEDHYVSATESGQFICAVRDRSEQADWEQERDQFKTLIETLDDPVYVIDETGRFEYVNNAFVELTGYSYERIIGAKPSLVKPPEAVQKGRDHLRQILSDDGPDQVYFDIELQPKDGEPVIVEDHMTALPYEGESFNGSVGILRDMSEIRAQQATLEERNERLDKFASIVSHDLRNPLNVVQNAIELAQQDLDHEALEIAADGAARMDALIDDLLTLARDGTQVEATDRVDLGSTAKRSWETTPTADATLQIDIDQMVTGDESRLQQLFENLFRNAIEHGGDTVTVTVGSLGSGFYVADDGPGIPTEDRETVFNAGYSTSPAGTGLGLTIVDQIVTAHGWDVTISESVQGGAQFDVRFE